MVSCEPHEPLPAAGGRLAGRERILPVLARFRPVLGWLTLVSVGAVAWALHATGAAAQSEPSPDAAVEGGRLFAEQCATCHGADGQGGVIPAGNGATAPPLVGPGAENVTLAYADLVMRTGRMPPPDNAPFDNRARRVTLTDSQRDAVNAFLATELEMPGDIPEPPAGDATRGQQLFATNCAACHGSTGAGGVAGAGAWTPAVNQLEPTTIAEAVRIGPFEMPAFSEQQLTDDDIGHIAAFLAEVEEQTRTPLGLIELNPVYASGFAALFVGLILIVVRIVAGKPAPLPDPAGQHSDPAVKDAG